MKRKKGKRNTVKRTSVRRSNKSSRKFSFWSNKKFLTVSAVFIAIGLLGGVHYLKSSKALVDLPDFRMECNIDHYSQDDPIVFPGVTGAAHMHSFYGNNATNAFSTPQSLFANPNGSCAYTPQFDKSAYWVPSVMIQNADGTTTRYSSSEQQLVVYYRRVGGANGPKVHPFPPGLVMIAGNSKATSPQDPSITSWDCGDGGPEYTSLPTCPGSNPVGFVSFPNCWDGVHLDSADHKSHMAYPLSETTGQCPADHPVPLPRIDFEDWVKGTAGGSNYHLSSDLQVGSKYTMHGDFVNAWDPRLLTGLIDQCMNTRLDNCSTVQVWNGCCGSTNGDVTVNGGTKIFNINDPKYASDPLPLPPPPPPSPTPTPPPTMPPPPPPGGKVGDLNGDNQVGLADLSILLSHWGTNTPADDLNTDGTIGVADLSILLSHWGT